jgi:hypothetical protein
MATTTTTVHTTYPLTRVVGYELADLIAKEQWIALVVDLFRAQLGEDATDDRIREEIVLLLDTLHGNALVPRTVPKRIERATR